MSIFVSYPRSEAAKYSSSGTGSHPRFGGTSASNGTCQIRWPLGMAACPNSVLNNCPEIFPKHNDGHEFLGNGNVGQISLSSFCSKARGLRHDLLNAMGTIRYNNLTRVVHVQLTFNFGIPSPLALLQNLHQILKGYHISGNLQAAKFVADLSFHSIDPFNFDSCALVFPPIVANPFAHQVLDEFDLVWYVHSSFMKLTNVLYQYPTPLGVTVLENSASSLNSLLCPCGSNNCPGFAFDQHELCSNHY